MTNELFRIIPGYPAYAVTRCGTVKSVHKDLVLSQYEWGGYTYVDTHYDSPTCLLKVSRAVALAWVDNPDPDTKTIVNHIDGDKLNNWYENLEWVTYSENNYHAIDNDLRRDNIKCKIRDFETKEVLYFASVRQASIYMGIGESVGMCQLLVKKFGALIKNRFEFRFQSDPTPWFYEHREEKIKPARYMVIVKEPTGECREVYSTASILKEFQVYSRKYGGTVPDLIKYAREKYPEKEFIVRDSYSENKFRITGEIKKVPPVKIKARRGTQTMTFPSLTQAAKYFDVDRSCIKLRLGSNISLDGYLFNID